MKKFIPLSCHPLNYHILKLIDIISYFIVREPNQEEYEDESILKRELTAEAHHETHIALGMVYKNRVCSTTGDRLSALTLQQGDNYLATLLHGMLMILQMLWTMTAMPQCWKVLSLSCHCK